MSDHLRTCHPLPSGYLLRDEYRIERVIRDSGFDVTYLATQLNNDRPVEIREYLPKGVARREPGEDRVFGAPADSTFDWGLQRFRNMARFFVQHPNILSPLHFFEAQGTCYFVEEHLEGKTLDLILRDGPLEELRIARFLFPILNAIRAVHAEGYLHRDIKPRNILLGQGDEHPFLIDFFMATEFPKAEHDAIVTPGYAPIEQYLSDGQQGPWTDLYAIGATLYRCITGLIPAEAPERLKARARGEPDPLDLSRARGKCSELLLQAVEAALELDLEARPQSITDFERMLASLLVETHERANATRSRASAAGADAQLLDIFLSYARDDFEQVRRLAEALGRDGFSVWWDMTLEGGTSFRQEIQRNLKSAGCVIVVWTNRSIESAWVHAEADIGFKSKKLLPIKLEVCDAPLPFNTLHELDFVRWNGLPDGPDYRRLKAGVEAMLARRNRGAV